MYRIEVKHIENTDKFRPAAIYFQEHGFYTIAPRGTSAYFEYWDQEVDRCLHGFTIDGEFISGYFYFYLNYFRIIKVFNNPDTGRLVRINSFPNYHDYDKVFFDTVQECERLGKHLSCIKARRKGHSYKMAGMMVRNFYLIPESKSYAYAAENEFLIKDGILTKAWEGMDFIDEHTAWYKKRQKVDTKTHKRASFIVDREGVHTEMGYKSEIIGVTLKNDVQKARGKVARLIVIEEAGKFPNLKEAWGIIRPSVEQGDNVFGLIIAFGTGGTATEDFQGLRELFYEPKTYNCLEIENIWDDGAIEPCGLFVPDYYNLSENFMDSQGNSLVKKAMKFLLSERENIIKSASDRTVIDRHISEHCFTPAEACLQISANIFPKEELIRHLAYIRTNESVRNFKQVGKLVYDENNLLKWVQSERPKDLTKYKVDKDQDPSGEIVIWEHPVDNPPFGLYIGGCDPYDHDKSQTGSLGSIFIYKRYQNFDNTYNMIVAEYTGRPSTADIFYENVLKLLLYYKATLLYENEKLGLATYFRNKHYEYLLADQPDIISKIIKNSNVQRGKGCHMVTNIKDYVEILTRDWLVEPRSEGRLNLHTILSEPLLEELIYYNDTGNFDRNIAFFFVMLYDMELHNLNVKEKVEFNKRQSLFSDGIFDRMGHTNEILFI